MATEIRTKVALNLTTSETLDTALTPGLGNRVVTHSGFDFRLTLDGDSIPDVDTISEQTLGDASGTLDLTALPTTQGTVNCTGKKLVAMRIVNRSTANDFSIAEGGTNGYAIGGNAVKVQEGGALLIYFADALGAVGASDKTLDYTFNAADEADITLIFG
jgi:hypothetical protein